MVDILSFPFIAQGCFVVPNYQNALYSFKFPHKLLIHEVTCYTAEKLILNSLKFEFESTIKTLTRSL